MKVKILMTKVITISTRGSLAGRTTMCSQETRTRVQRTFSILVSAEIERRYYLVAPSSAPIGRHPDGENRENRQNTQKH